MRKQVVINIGGRAKAPQPQATTPTDNKKKLTSQQITKIKELYGQGMSQRKIAEEVGTSPTTARKVIKGEY